MGNKFLRIAAFIIAAVLTAGLAIFANELVGNPVSKYLVKKSAQSYIEKTYPNDNFYIEDIGYSFKDKSYYVDVKCENSLDKYFNLRCDMLGSLLDDSYDSAITKKENTVRRVDEEYRQLVDSVFNSPTFKLESDINFGKLCIDGFGEYEYNINVPNKTFSSFLELDKIYDVREMGKDMGIITLYVQDKEVSEERFAQVLLEVKKVFDYNKVPFFAIDLVLEPIRNEGEARGKGIRAEKILYSDIADDEGYLERVRNSIKATEEFY